MLHSAKISAMVPVTIAMILVSNATVTRAFRGLVQQSLFCNTQKSFYYLPPCHFSRRFLWTNNNNNSNSNNNNNNKEKTTQTNDSVVTVKEAYISAMKQLEQQGVSEPDWSTAHLLASALDLPWSNGFSQLQRAMTLDDNDLLNRVLTPSQTRHFQSMMQRRVDHEPLQYILGQWDFLDYEQLIMRPPLLCPRPETEELVELVKRDIQNSQKQQQQQQQDINILDVGAGTGVIGIALADQVLFSRVTAIDIEPVAVQTSLDNAKLVLGPNFESRYSAHLCSAQEFSSVLNMNNDDNNTQQSSCFDVVVSNPPYIPQCDMNSLSRDVVQFESEQALCGGQDGMDVIRTIVRKWASEWGKKPTSVCWMEVDPSHPELLQAWLNETQAHQKWGVFLESTHQDLSGRDRFVKLAWHEQ